MSDYSRNAVGHAAPLCRTTDQMAELDLKQAQAV